LSDSGGLQHMTSYLLS